MFINVEGVTNNCSISEQVSIAPIGSDLADQAHAE